MLWALVGAMKGEGWGWLSEKEKAIMKEFPFSFDRLTKEKTPGKWRIMDELWRSFYVFYVLGLLVECWLNLTTHNTGLFGPKLMMFVLFAVSYSK